MLLLRNYSIQYIKNTWRESYFEAELRFQYFSPFIIHLLQSYKRIGEILADLNNYQESTRIFWKIILKEQNKQSLTLAISASLVMFQFPINCQLWNWKNILRKPISRCPIMAHKVKQIFKFQNYVFCPVFLFYFFKF